MSPTQINSLRVGDLIRFNRTLRKVRKVSLNPNNPAQVWYVYFAILRRSWTNRPYTVYSHHDLRKGHIQLVQRGVRLRTTKLERLVQKEIDQPDHQHARFITADKTVGKIV